MWEIKAAGEGLSADENVNMARFDVFVKISKILGFFVVAVKAGDFGIGKELRKLGFEQFGAKTFMNNTSVVAIRAAGRDFFFVPADMTT